MARTHARTPSTSVWDVRANEFDLRILNILVWARQNGGEEQGRSFDLRAAVTLPGLMAIACDRRLPVLGGDSAFDLTDMPEDLAAPLRRYVEETGGYDPALPPDRQSSEYPVKLHSFILMTAGPGLAERLA